MISDIETRLIEKGLTLPHAAAPAANYVPFVCTGNLVFISGQLPMQDGKLQYKGTVGRDVSIEDAIKAAEIVALNILAQLKAACGGDLSRVKRCVRLGGFVACTNEFTEQPKVINGASNLMVELLGDAGRHSRAAVGTNALPLGTPVEIDAVFEIQ